MTRFWPVTIFIVGCSLAMFWLAWDSYDGGSIRSAIHWTFAGGFAVFNAYVIRLCWKNTRWEVRYYLSEATLDKIRNLKDENGNPVFVKEEIK